MYGDGRKSFIPADANKMSNGHIPQVSLTLPDPFPNGHDSALLDADSELAYLDRQESYAEQLRTKLSPPLELTDAPTAESTSSGHTPTHSIAARPSTSMSNARSSAAGTPAYHSAHSSFSSHRRSPTSTRQMSIPIPPATPDRLSPYMGNPASGSTAILSTYADSPPSKTSLVISEGEDVDAFHIRNTYAMLEQSGVKGDGWEEGVERTRARVGPSRSSQLNAMGAVGDGTERARELDEREIALLSSVDR
jgi:USP6 N-terminal-like protein